MSENLIETVTIPLYKFRKMEEEIKQLRRENLQKTIIKEIMPSSYGHAAFILLLIVFTCLITFT